jgi:peptide/nickel transport system substrate-binding protein
MEGSTVSLSPKRVALAVAGLMLVVTGCAPSSSPSSNSGKTLVVDTSFQSASMDPGQELGITDRLADEQMYQPLMLVDQQNYSKLDPNVAQSYTVSPDGLNYTYQLRHTVQFSDGTPLTSADVVFSLMRLKNLKGTNAPYMSGLTVTAPDAFTVVISSATPNPAIPFDVAIQAAGIVNSKVVMAHGGTDAPNASSADTAQSFLNQQSAGSGPYVLVSFDAQSLIVLAANAKYWAANPVYSKVQIRNVPAQTQLLDIQSSANTVALDLSPVQAAGLDKSKAESLTAHSFEVFLIELNVNPAISKVSASQDFRSAVRYAVDYKALLSLAGPGIAQAPGLMPLGFTGALPANQVISKDLAKARTYLASSGLQSPTISLEYPSDLTTNGLTFGDLAQEIQINLKDIGIAVNLVPEPNVVWKARWKAGKIPMIVYSASGVSFDPSSMLLFSPSGLFGIRMGFVPGQAPDLDSLFAQIAAAPTNDLRAPLYMQAQTALNANAAFVPLFQGASAVASSKDVGGLNLDGLGEVRFWQMT